MCQAARRGTASEHAQHSAKLLTGNDLRKGAFGFMPVEHP